MAAAVAMVAAASAALMAISVTRGRHAPHPQALPAPGAGSAPQTIRLAHEVLDVPAGWELITRGTELLRIELRSGVVVRTNVPPLQSSGPSFLIVERHLVIIRPLDAVPGYVVVDGEPARELTGLLAGGGPAFPGPDIQHVWAPDSRAQRLMLVGLDGRPTGPIVDTTDVFPVAGDETGSLVVEDKAGTWLESGTSSPQLITAGNLLAIGPTRWLTAQRGSAACDLIVTDRASGARHVLGTVTCQRNVPFTGTISPDGQTAAMVVDSSPGAEAVHLVDLTTGADRALTPRPYFGDGSNGHLAWSPDSKTLFFLSVDGQIDFTDVHGSSVQRLPLDLQTTAAQIALRSS